VSLLLTPFNLLRVDECVCSVAAAEKGFQAAARKCLTVSPHCPREVSSLVTRHVLWRPGEEDDSLPWVRCPNRLVEFERFRRGVSANVEHYEIVDMGLPEKSRGGNLFGDMHLDSVTSQDGSARFARSLKAVDEENSLATKIGTFWRWLKHSTLPRFVAANRYRMPAALSKSETARTTVVFLEPSPPVA
jgi:hypothetical protein